VSNALTARTVTAPERQRTDEPAHTYEPDPPWVVIVWNDPINLMSYVTFVFQKLFGYPREKAHELMMQVHVDGRSAVWTGTRERAEAYVSALHEYGLWATMQKDD
jgi:ATP-dependent Clp protease adaptor protein ClpS